MKIMLNIFNLKLNNPNLLCIRVTNSFKKGKPINKPTKDKYKS